MLNVKVNLVSTFKRHGNRGPQPSKVRTTASSKFKAILKSKFSKSEDAEDEYDEEDVETSNSNSNSGSKDSEEGKGSTTAGESKDRQPKKYGEHTGNVHVYTFVDDSYETNEELESIGVYVTNLTSAFESKPSFSLKKARNDYRVYKDEVLAKYAKLYGSQLDEKTTTAMFSELHKMAFTYTTHQIIITISSDQPIEGARYNDETGLYYITIKSKMIYRKDRTLLSTSEIENLEGVDDESVKLTTTSLVRIPVSLRYDSQNQRYVVVYPNSNKRVSAVDGYVL